MQSLSDLRPDFGLGSKNGTRCGRRAESKVLELMLQRLKPPLCLYNAVSSDLNEHLIYLKSDCLLTARLQSELHALREGHELFWAPHEVESDNLEQERHEKLQALKETLARS